MDRNTVTGLILILAVFIVFSVYNNRQLTKGYNEAVKLAESELLDGDLEDARANYLNALRFKPNDPVALEKLNDINIALGLVEAEVKANEISQNSMDYEESSLPDSVISAQLANRYGAFASAVKGENEFITLENDLIELKISSKGGRIYSARLKEFVRHDSTDLILFSGDSSVFSLNFYTADNKAIQTNDLYFTPVSSQRSFSAVADSQKVALRLYAGTDKYIEYDYILKPNKYSVELNVIFKNVQDVLAANQNSISLDWQMYMPQQEKGRINELNYTALKYKYVDENSVEGSIRATRDEDKYDVPSKFSWVAYQDQFFSSVLMADSYFLNGNLTTKKTPESEKYIRYYASDIGMPYESSYQSEFDMKFYFGPNHISTLKKEGNELHKIIFLGRNIIGWISRPVFNFLEKYISSYGIIILILTILIKLVLFPLTFKSYQSTAKMQIIKPMIDEINAKYPDHKDDMRRQQLTMDLYKRADISVMGGCLPTLLQFPILFAMFRFFPVSIELRQQPFLWATDLSTYDSICNLPFSIPMYGDHVSLFTLLMTISSILSMKIANNSSAQAGPNQLTMKMMTYMFPIMFLFMFNNFSSGLTYYYFLANIISVGQNYAVKRMIDKEKVLNTIKESYKKPLPKSKWQKRLEEAQKQQRAMRR